MRNRTRNLFAGICSLMLAAVGLWRGRGNGRSARKDRPPRTEDARRAGRAAQSRGRRSARRRVCLSVERVPHFAAIHSGTEPAGKDGGRTQAGVLRRRFGRRGHAGRRAEVCRRVSRCVSRLVRRVARAGRIVWSRSCSAGVSCRQPRQPAISRTDRRPVCRHRQAAHRACPARPDWRRSSPWPRANRVATPRTEAIGCPFELRKEEPASSKVTYARDIAPIVFAHCAECHRPGEVAPFSLLTYQDAAKRAKGLVRATERRLMPPWRADVHYGDFLDERRLTERQIALVKAWADAERPKATPPTCRRSPSSAPTDGGSARRTWLFRGPRAIHRAGRRPRHLSALRDSAEFVEGRDAGRVRVSTGQSARRASLDRSHRYTRRGRAPRRANSRARLADVRLDRRLNHRHSRRLDAGDDASLLSDRTSAWRSIKGPTSWCSSTCIRPAR